LSEYPQKETAIMISNQLTEAKDLSEEVAEIHFKTKQKNSLFHKSNVLYSSKCQHNAIFFNADMCMSRKTVT
jgi:hypothetical protein